METHTQFTGVYPTDEGFAFRLMSGFMKTVGTLSEKDFRGLFEFPAGWRVLHRFRRALHRGYIQMNMNPPRLGRLKGLPFPVQRAYLRQVKEAQCKAWAAPYELYKEAVTKGLDREVFYMWWKDLIDTERVLFLDACVHILQQSSYNVWFKGMGNDAQIYVQMAGGADSGQTQVF